MKILHTADLHLGVKLHGHDLMDDHVLFLNWLLEFIKEEGIGCLLISGDIFDMANPSNEARKLYFNFLTRMPRACQVIITGGNHDSPAMLDAPREILEALNISVIGGKPEKLDDLIIPLMNGDKIVGVVAAVPFLRDMDLRNSVVGQGYEDTQLAIREGIRQVFDNCAHLCEEKYGKIPAIAMGHLYAQGAKVSDSEREIQIGNLAGFNSEEFATYFNYYALGHIHKPQQVATGERKVYYSGSPVPLSFSEKEDQKRILLFDTADFEIKSIEIPSNRSLVRIEGDLDVIKSKLRNLPANHKAFNCLLEVHLKEEEYSAVRVRELETLLSDFVKEGYELVHRTIAFEKNRQQNMLLYEKGTNIEELNPIEVFEKRMEGEPFSAEEKQEVKEAFLEILQEIQQQP